MKKLIILSLVTMVVLFASPSSYSQADTLIQVCSQHLAPPYISDGQQYRALLNGDEVAEFHATFYGGSTYRLVGCSGLSDGNLVFTVYDKERNTLFSSKDYENTPYWDLKFSSTIDCIIEAELDSKNLESGFAILLIGFKQ
ncbi:MAG: hypothetical protein C0594_10285 [Marinilabiliales bacterium]|nr:MAG: hypothetical protein C0594_10285 [Marinilabiliales bacterium]